MMGGFLCVLKDILPIRKKFRNFVKIISSKLLMVFSTKTLWKSYKEEYAVLTRLGVPVFVTQLGVVAVSFADTIMVGAYGTNELAAAAFVNNFLVVPFVMLIGFSAGLTPLVGALFSKRDYFGVGQLLRVGIRLNGLASILFTLIMGILYFFLDKMGQPEELLPLIRPYYLIVMAGIIPSAIFNACQQTANGVTDTRMPMWLILSANLLNIIGNYILIFGHFGMPELGLNGAGYATVSSRICATIAILSIMFYGKRYKPYKEGITFGSVPDGLSKKILKTSLPIMIQYGIEVMLWAFGAVVCGWFGKIQLAAYQVTNTMAQFGYMTYLSFSTAVSIRVANKMGLHDIAGIRRSNAAALHLNVTLGVLVSLLYFFCSIPIFHIFTQDQAVVDAALLLIPPLALYQIFDASQVTLGSALRGTAYVNPLLWTSIISYLLIGFPAIILLGAVLGLQSVGVYYSFCIVLVSAAILFWYWFNRTLKQVSV
jgi:MATE family multidrug resistance protein